MDTSLAAVTVSVALPGGTSGLAGSVALIVVMPTATEAANPVKPGALLMVAIPTFEDVQVTDDVRFCVVKSEYIPVAINC